MMQDVRTFDPYAEICWGGINENPTPSYLQQRYLISDRKNFSNPNEFSNFPWIAEASPNLCFIPKEFDFDASFANRKVLVLLHGFTASKEEVEETLHGVAEKVKDVYDTVIAYLYPACTSPLQYDQARANAFAAARLKLPAILRTIAETAKCVDIAAHSMGVFLAMNALNQPKSPKIGSLFLLGGADKQEIILNCDQKHCSPYKKALEKAQDIYVLFSCRDEILPWHSFLKVERTIGRPGQLSQSDIGENVRMIDTSSIVKSHSGYLYNDVVINFLKQTLLQKEKGYSLNGKQFALTINGLRKTSEQQVCSVGMEDAAKGIFQQITDAAFGFLGHKRLSKIQYEI